MLISGLLIATTLVTSVDAGSWSLAIREVKHVSRNKTLGPLNDIYTEVLNFDRSYYRATVYVGTPPKPFQVMIDTGSPILWIPRKGCIAKGQQTTGNCESGKYVYDPKESVTAENLDTPLSISYGDGSSWMKGQYYKDFFSFGENSRFKEPITFGVVHEMTDEDQGILGLANSFDPHERGSLIMHEAWRQKLLDAPIFTIYMRKCPDYEDCEKYGTITIGSVDKEMCGEIEGNVNVDPNLTRFELGAARVNSPFEVTIDTGAPDIYVPSDIYKQLMKKIKASPTTSGDYFVRCTAHVDITLVINKREYVIPGNQLLVNLHTDLCTLRLVPWDSHNGKWILGIPFYRYVTFRHNHFPAEPSHHGKILRVEKGLILLTSLCISPPFVVFPVSLRGSSKVGNGFVGAKTLMCEKNIKENEG